MHLPAKFFFFLAILFLLKGASALDAECTGSGTTVRFSVTFAVAIDAFLSRTKTSADALCEGTLKLNDLAQRGDQTLILNLGDDVFRDLPLVTEIDLSNNRIHTSHADMYLGSDMLTSMIVTRGTFSTLDSSVTFAPSVTSLDLGSNYQLGNISPGFFIANSRLRELKLSSLQFTFPNIEPLSFQTATELKTLDFSNPFKAGKLRKTMFSNMKNFQYLDLSLWTDLTEVDPEALSDITTTELLMDGWPFTTIDQGLFSGSSIKKLSLVGSKLHYLGPRGFSDLKETTQLNLAKNDITAIESKAFQNFSPGPFFNLVLDGVECCYAQGLFELTSTSGDISVNGNSQNYTCIQPNGDFKEILFQTDPALDLPCCYDKLLYYEPNTDRCEACTVTPFCNVYDSNVCYGSKLSCSECESGYYLTIDDVNSETNCEACINDSNCQSAGTTCVSENDSTKYLKCEVCKEGYSLNAVSGLCEECQAVSGLCQNFSSTCVAGTTQLQCDICNAGDIILNANGQCATLEGSKLSTPIIIAIACSTVVLFAIILIAGVSFALHRRKQRKENAIKKLFGIGSEQVIELETDEEFQARVALGQVEPEVPFKYTTYQADNIETDSSDETGNTQIDEYKDLNTETENLDDYKNINTETENLGECRNINTDNTFEVGRNSPTNDLDVEMSKPSYTKYLSLDIGGNTDANYLSLEIGGNTDTNYLSLGIGGNADNDYHSLDDGNELKHDHPDYSLPDEKSDYLDLDAAYDCDKNKNSDVLDYESVVSIVNNANEKHLEMETSNENKHEYALPDPEYDYVDLDNSPDIDNIYKSEILEARGDSDNDDNILTKTPENIYLDSNNDGANFDSKIDVEMDDYSPIIDSTVQQFNDVGCQLEYWNVANDVSTIGENGHTVESTNLNIGGEGLTTEITAVEYIDLVARV